MSIEQELARIATALEKLTAAPIQAATAATAPDTSFLDETSYSIDDVREALKQYMDKTSPAEAKKILEKFGAEKLSDLSESKFADLISMLKKA